ncbi:MAG: hypothetical protein V3S46_04165 [Nitrospinota bacterium]
MLADSEEISRYLFDSKSFNRNTKKAKRFKDFLPRLNQNTSIDELSVFRTSGVEPSVIWEIGDKYAGVGRSKLAKARALFSVSIIKNIEGCKLKIESEPTPHPLHANIINWPEKPLQMNIAQQLMLKAEVDVRNNSLSS